MHQIDSAGSVAVLPTPAAAGSPGFFSRGNPSTGTPATVLDDDFFNAVMMELINVVTAGGGTPTKGTNTQVLAAIRDLISDSHKARGESATYGGTPTSGAPTLYQKVYTFVAPCDGVVQAMAYSNMGGGGPQPGAVQNSVQIARSVSGSVGSSDITRFPMTNCIVAPVVEGETVTITTFSNTDGSVGSWNSIGGGSSYMFVPTA
ncbi:hypothetical protein [Caballeronia cordobensis]|uniref:hypothetical protein n=1 Tax=Caballeronia cordobensis TaxID=1353886 RepID=UPI00045F0AB3|nr:uncharacterized protein BRPE67_BCDS09920 [Burkholderia sp. RPE67]